ncbi:tRNA-splicing endonuclease subunit sen54 [Blyttiomyces sp. JEL0837]|nr:tRNA-splicing endonuclease subunit sen54 [Blyttiomyces sp. JEL0837]
MSAAGPDEGEIDDKAPDYSALTTQGRASIPIRSGDGDDGVPSGLSAPFRAMYEAIAVERSFSNKTSTFATWNQKLGLAFVTNPRGTQFKSMGTSLSGGSVALFPEEALYLLERGSIVLRSSDIIPSRILDRVDKKADHVAVNVDQGLTADLIGSMSLQQAYSILLRPGFCTPDQFSVYSYLKRSGYVVFRRLNYEIPPNVSQLTQRHGLVTKVFGFFRNLALGFWRFTKSFAQTLFCPWRWFAFNARPKLTIQADFDVYQPNSHFKKGKRPPPDFQVLVVNAFTKIPDINNLQALFDAKPPQTQLKAAVVDQGQISFLSLTCGIPIDPNIPSKKNTKKMTRKARMAAEGTIC